MDESEVSKNESLTTGHTEANRVNNSMDNRLVNNTTGISMLSAFRGN